MTENVNVGTLHISMKPDWSGFEQELSTKSEQIGQKGGFFNNIMGKGKTKGGGGGMFGNLFGGGKKGGGGDEGGGLFGGASGGGKGAGAGGKGAMAALGPLMIIVMVLKKLLDIVKKFVGQSEAFRMLNEAMNDFMGGLLDTMFVLLIMGIGQLVKIITDLWEWFSSGVADFWAWLTQGAADLWGWLSEGASDLWGWLMEGAELGTQFVDWLMSGPSGFIDWIFDAVSGFIDWLFKMPADPAKLPEWLMAGLSGFTDWLYEGFIGLWEWLAAGVELGTKFVDWLMDGVSGFKAWIFDGVSGFLAWLYDGTAGLWDWLTKGTSEMGAELFKWLTGGYDPTKGITPSGQKLNIPDYWFPGKYIGTATADWWRPGGDFVYDEEDIAIMIELGIPPFG